MREIKFRGWHVQNKRMFSAEEMAVDQLTLLPTGAFINVHGVHTHLSTIYDREKFIPMQFTGLKDKNGKEIYEGDIVKIIQCECIGQSADGSEEEWIPCEGEVLFEDAMFVFEGHSAGSLPLYAYKDDLEVIGNIFVTPK